VKRTILILLLLVAGFAFADDPVLDLGTAGFDSVYTSNFDGVTADTWPELLGSLWMLVPKWYLDSIVGLYDSMSTDSLAFHHADTSDSAHNLWADTATAHWFVGPVFRWDNAADAPSFDSTNRTMYGGGARFLQSTDASGDSADTAFYSINVKPERIGSNSGAAALELISQRDSAQDLHVVRFFGSGGGWLQYYDNGTHPNQRTNAYWDGFENLSKVHDTLGDSLTNPARRAYMGYAWNDLSLFGLIGYGHIAQFESAQARMMVDTLGRAEVVTLGSSAGKWSDTSDMTPEGFYTNGILNARASYDGPTEDTTTRLATMQFVRDSAGGGSGANDSFKLGHGMLNAGDYIQNGDSLAVDDTIIPSFTDLNESLSVWATNPVIAGWGIEIHDDTAGHDRITFDKAAVDTHYLLIGGKAANATKSDSALVSASTHTYPDSNTVNPSVINSTRFRGAFIGNAATVTNGAYTNASNLFTGQTQTIKAVSCTLRLISGTDSSLWWIDATDTVRHRSNKPVDWGETWRRFNGTTLFDTASGNAATITRMHGTADTAGNSKLLQGKDTTALWNAKTLQGRDTTTFGRPYDSASGAARVGSLDTTALKEHTLAGKAATAGTADTTAGGAARATLAANATNAYNADSLGHLAATRYDTTPTLLDSFGVRNGDGKIRGIPLGVYEKTEFLIAAAGGYAPWFPTAIATGTAAAVVGTANHPGVLQITSSTSANSGQRFILGATSFLLAGGEWTDFVVALDTTSGSTYRLGWHNATASTAPTDGAYLQIAGTVLRLRTANNSTRDSSASTYTLTANTYYRLRDSVNANATRVYGRVLSEAGSSLWFDSVSTQIPTTAGREVGHGFVVTNSGTTAYALMRIDWMMMWIMRGLVR
jgi:hypothetical protein